MMIQAYLVKIDGTVQGVGFRPFIYSLAASLDIKGLVYNIGTGVIIEAECSKEKLDLFVELIRSKAPPLSDIRDITVKETIVKSYRDFSIGSSIRQEESNVFIPPDVAVCADCIEEFFDVNDRRYLYPFINCTNCGPRFTLIDDTPYDRANTTMKVFEMCPICKSQYHDPGNRRYHAEPISCPECGPQLRLLDASGTDMNEKNPACRAAELLAKGHIIAVKGIGGYHLACDALNTNAVHTLRKKKHRDEKPFALMADSLQTIKKYCKVGPEEEELLTGIKKPVVLLQKLTHVRLPEEIAPLNPYLGMMLPYTPVHLLLFNPLGKKDRGEGSKLELLIMTSGNRSSEPIFYTDKEAVKGLQGIADFFLVHNREICTRADDSVTRVFMGKEYAIRRSRGYVPSSVTVEVPLGGVLNRDVCVIGVGGELKNTFCLNKKNEFYISQHIGDLENLETLEAFERSVKHYTSMLRVRPEVIAYDLHPDYLSTCYALSSRIGIKIPIQHHHAHHASCMAENALNGKTIGVVFDGTGFGEDGCIWGGEFFAGGIESVQRIGHLDYVPMPGGEASVREPWRMAVSYIISLFPGSELSYIKEGTEFEGIRLFDGIKCDRLNAVTQMIGKKLNSPLTSSMGRLFDAVSALIGVRNKITYEGQAAIEMEYLAAQGDYGSYGFELAKGGKLFIIKTNSIFSGIIKDMKNRVPKEIISARFHETVSEIVLAGCKHARMDTGLDRVTLSGGVFQNITLLEKSINKLERSGFRVYIHSRVPANDGGISLGQAVIAAARVKGGNLNVSGRTGEGS